MTWLDLVLFPIAMVSGLMPLVYSREREGWWSAWIPPEMRAKEGGPR